jgi:hypothetical protein
MTSLSDVVQKCVVGPKKCSLALKLDKRSFKTFKIDPPANITMSSQISVPKDHNGHISTTLKIIIIVVGLFVLAGFSIYQFVRKYVIRITRHMLLVIWNEEQVNKFMDCLQRNI